MKRLESYISGKAELRGVQGEVDVWTMGFLLAVATGEGY